MGMSEKRRFPAPWTVVRGSDSFAVNDANGVTVAHVHCRDDLHAVSWSSAHEHLTSDEARRIALAIARLPEFLRPYPEFVPRHGQKRGRYWQASHPYHIALPEAYVNENYDEIVACCAYNNVPFDPTGDEVLASLDDVDHRITILGEAVNEGIQRIETIFARTEVIETTDAVKLRAAQRAVDKKAPFHKDKNSIGDAILIETYRDILAGRSNDSTYAFVTHNKHDFSNMVADERQPHPDLADLFADDKSIYALALGEVLNSYAPEWMEEVKWEFEYLEEPRLLSELAEAENLLFRQVWYNRHWNRRIAIERGKQKLVTKEEWDKATPKRRHKMTVDTVWVAALAAAKKTEDEVGIENLGPWTDFEWGMLNGKLSALRWVMGSEWDFLDT